MKRTIANKAALVGAGVGVALFALFGLLPGSFLGGVMGLNIAGLLFGHPVSSAVLPRLIVALGMLLGVMVAGAVFVVAGSAAGWLVGLAVEALRPVKLPKEEKAKV